MNTAPINSDRWQHVKRGETYTLLGLATVRTEMPIGDSWPEMVVYRADDGTITLAPKAEFFDGRFVPVDTKTPAKIDEGHDGPGTPSSKMIDAGLEVLRNELPVTGVDRQVLVDIWLAMHKVRPAIDSSPAPGQVLR